MKKGVVIGLAIAAILIIAAGIYFYNTTKTSTSNLSVAETCAEINERCGGGIQGPNGENNNVDCCSGLVCNHEVPGGYNEIGFCNNKTEATAPVASFAQTYDIELKGFAFNPITLNIKAGDTIVWTNKDPAKHTVTSDSGTELDSALFGQGETYSHTFTTAGTYNYHCAPHTSMKGKVIVA
ncbi:MAG: cupredoxin family copper-binding protein [Nanoarchaeota archaeon]